jgi:hypothetical protein
MARPQSEATSSYTVDSGTASLRLLTAAFVLLCVLGSTWALYRFVVFPGMNLYPRARFGSFISGRCDRPFCQRVLVPAVVRSAMAVMPAGVRSRIASGVRGLLEGDPRLEYGRDYPVEFGLAVAVIFGSLLGFAFAVRRLAQVSFGTRCWQCFVVPVAALVLLPGMYSYMNYVYDLPNLFLFTLGLLLIAAHSHAFLPVFIVATINKETAILLTLVWVLENRGRLSHGALLRGVGIQLLVWLVARGAIAFVYRGNPGDAVEWHLPRTLEVVSRIARAPFNGTLLGQTRKHWTAGVALVTAAAFLVSLRRAPRFLRYAASVGIPIVVLGFFFSFLEELRVYYEIYPTVLLTLGGGVAALFRRPVPTLPTAKAPILS